MKLAITGASGFVASALINHYPNYIAIHRNDSVEEIKRKLADVEVVINLAGAPIIKRWSSEYKKILISSRIATTRNLVQAINESEVKHFISASAVGIYPNDIPCSEKSDISTDNFLANLVKSWEKEAHKCIKPTTILRFGIILGANGGALKQMLTPFKLALGGVIGDGSAIMSWIDIDDLIRIYQFVIEHKLEGTYNATTPQPVSNFEFTKTLGKVLHRPTVLPLPEFVLRLIYGEASTVLTDSKEVYPNALETAGFEFSYPTIESSLKHLLKP